MRPIEYTHDDIIAAGQALRAEGRRVNGASLHKRLGGGRAERLFKVWQEHLASVGNVSASEPADQGLPPEMATEINAMAAAVSMQARHFTDRLWAAAVQAAEAKLAADRELTRQLRADTQQELEAAADRADALEDQLSAAKAEAAELAARLAESQREAQTAHAELGSLRQAAQFQAEKLKEAIAEQDKMTVTLVEANTDNQKIRSEVARLEGQLAESIKHNAELTTVIAQLTHALSSLAPNPGASLPPANFLV